MRKTSWRLTLSIAALAVSAGHTAAIGRPYDIVIENGRVMDPETGFDRIANVGVTDGVIRSITSQPLSGSTVIDAHGLVIAPGFIDLHSHASYPLGYDLQAQDGVTTSLELEEGVFPVEPFYAARAGHSRINYGASVGYESIRIKIFTGIDDDDLASRSQSKSKEILAHQSVWAETPLNSVQLARAEAMLEIGVHEGGLGLGLLEEYLPGAGRVEIFRMIQVAATLKAPVFVHARAADHATGDGLINPIQEMIADGAATGASIHICHIGSKGLGEVPLLLQLIDGAHNHGVDITTEVYPYDAGSTLIGSALFSEGWQERLGISYSELEWPLTGERLNAASFKKYRTETPAGYVIIHEIPEKSVDAAISDPSVMIASDAVPFVNGTGHPRGAGTFSRVLGLYVRNKKLLPLMLALRKMTLMPAQRLETISAAMKRKGRVQVGADADLTLFDPQVVSDQATYRDPTRPAVGIPYVIVAGKLVVANGRIVDSAYPGQPIRSGH